MFHERTLTNVILVVAVFLLPATSLSALLQVPAEYPSIQAGIDAAVKGDTVLVADGNYFERINLLGKDILISSEILLDGDTAHITSTIIDAGRSDSGSVVTAIGDVGEMPSATLRGFTIQKGSSDQGGAMFVRRYYLTIRDCVLRNNSANYGGVAYLHSRAYVTFESSKIYGNSESIVTLEQIGLFGECNLINSKIYDTPINLLVNLNILGSYLDNCPVEFWTYSFMTVINSEFNDCSIFARNESLLSIDSSMLLNTSVTTQNSGIEISSSLIAGEVMIQDDIGSHMNAENVTFIGGIGIEQGETLKEARYSAITLNKCIISVDSGAAVACLGNNTNLSFSCCDIYTPDSLWLQGIPASFDTSQVFFHDPLFCHPPTENYGLAADSPCLPENNDCDELIGALSNDCPPLLICGDADSDGEIDVNDIQFIFLYVISSGTEPYPYWKADTNCSGYVDIDDAVYLISYLFGGGEEPCADCQ